MKFNLPTPPMITEAREQVRFTRSKMPRFVDLLIEIAIFVSVFLVCALLINTLLTLLLLGFAMLVNGNFTGEFLASFQEQPEFILVMLFITVGTIIGVLIYCRIVERRKLNTLGFRRGRILQEYFVGLFVGAVMFATAAGIAFACGALNYEGLAGASAFIIVLFFCAYLVQGMSEEVLCRGYFLNTLARKQHVAVAVAVSACVFGALHLLNDNVVPLGIINIILFGSFIGVYLLKRGSIWGAAAVHSAWNFTQGNVFGISVSGWEVAPSIFSFTPTAGETLISGGAFGIEAGLAASTVLVIALVIALLMKPAAPQNQPDSHTH